VKIEIWSDVVCPWCYIGKRRLEQALGEFEHADEVEITWRSFQLNPDAPFREAVPTLDYLARRFGPQAQAMVSRVADLGRSDGLDLNFGTALTVNTMDAHRVLHLAADHDGGGQPGAQVQVDGWIAADQRPPAHLGLSGRLGVGGHPDLRPGERGAQLAAHGQAVPAVDGRGQLHPVLERDPEGGYADRDELAARRGAVQQVARDPDPAAEAGLGPERAVAAHGGRGQLVAGQVAHGGSDLRAAKVEPEHDRGSCHDYPPVRLGVTPAYHQDS